MRFKRLVPLSHLVDCTTLAVTPTRLFEEGAHHTVESAVPAFADATPAHTPSSSTVVVHGYAGVDDRLVWDMVVTRLDDLRLDVDRLLDSA